MRNHLLLLCFCLGATSFPFTQTTCEKASDMVATIEKFHYEAKPIDSSFILMFLDILMDKSDPYGLFLTSEDIIELENTSNYLSEDLEGDSCIFYEKFASILKHRISDSKSFLEQLNNKSFSVIKHDSITIDNGKYFVSKAEIAHRWEKWLQYLTVKIVDGDEVTSSELDSVYQTVLLREQCRLESYFINNSLDTKVSELYLTSLANTFDPHTSYFSSGNKESFYEGLSDESLSFGFDLDRNERGQLQVASIIPGGAAWLSNKINEGIILSTVITSDEVKDFSCIRYSEAMSFLNTSKVKSAKFVFETESGVLDTISLRKTLVSVQENIVQSFILKDSTSTIGYIYLPSFYTSENEFGISTNGCSADISRELIRLKSEGIEGLIIDLRSNGGGHMLEAINLIGIFIDYGTLGVIDSKDEKPALIKDKNRGLIYNGPLTIMIDEFSASASEFFAVTLQDYNRAIIVGSTSYGKSTAQTVLPIESHRYLSPDLMDFEPKDFVKLTVNRFYRVNGDTYQRQGVLPDIIFPSVFDELETGERSSPTAILANHIDKETYFKTPYTLPREELKIKYEMRNANNPHFDMVKNISSLYSKYWKSTTFPIDLNSKNVDRAAYLEGVEKHSEYSVAAPYSVNNPTYLAGYSNRHDSEKEINASAMEEIKEDQGIVEAYLVTKDLINIKNK
jgi:carboxyl-terminal processing protease